MDKKAYLVKVDNALVHHDGYLAVSDNADTLRRCFKYLEDMGRKVKVVQTQDITDSCIDIATSPATYDLEEKGFAFYGRQAVEYMTYSEYMERKTPKAIER